LGFESDIVSTFLDICKPTIVRRRDPLVVKVGPVGIGVWNLKFVVEGQGLQPLADPKVRESTKP